MHPARLSLALYLLASLTLRAQDPQEQKESQAAASEQSKPAAEKPKPEEKEKKFELEEKPPVVTHHEIRPGGRSLKYTATTGFMPIANEEGTIEAYIFYVA